MGEVSIFLDEGVTIQSSLGNGATTSGIFSAAAATNATGVLGGAGDIAQGNQIEAQKLTIQGSNLASVDILKDASTNSIVESINKVSDSTGVTAKATTTMTLSDLSVDGTVSFTLSGTLVSASVTAGDLTNLVTDINAETSKTGVVATLNDSKDEVILVDSKGDDISILDFANSSGGTVVAQGEGDATTLTNGRGDSTVVGGQIEFVSNIGSFQVSSNQTSANGGLFTLGSDGLNGSTKTTIDQIDVTTVAGAQSAISAIDGALAAIDANRADLGAVQNRFTKTVSNLTTTVENLSASRSRIQDTDFAAETANLTRSQIMVQAGTAMLAQANQVPQGVLSLLG